MDELNDPIIIDYEYWNNMSPEEKENLLDEFTSINIYHDDGSIEEVKSKYV